MGFATFNSGERNKRKMCLFQSKYVVNGKTMFIPLTKENTYLTNETFGLTSVVKKLTKY